MFDGHKLTLTKLTGQRKNYGYMLRYMVSVNQYLEKKSQYRKIKTIHFGGKIT